MCLVCVRLMKNLVNNDFGEDFDTLFRHLADNQQYLTVFCNISA